MSVPTFGGTAMITEGERQNVGSPQSRTYRQSLPGVEGVYVQENPLGPRTIVVTGLLKTTLSNYGTAALAFAAMSALLTTWQAKIGSMQDYIGTDGRTYDDCELLSFEHRGQMLGVPAGATWQGMAAVQAILMHPVPSAVA